MLKQVQANIIVALGDLAFRFPNALEPWNPRIYNRLTDESPVVRANAIMVLTHLILNDMVKVRTPNCVVVASCCVFFLTIKLLPF